MKVGEFVLVHLVNPKEKFWGILKDRDTSGVTARGLSLEGFEVWLHEIARRETVTVLPSTVFFPAWLIMMMRSLYSSRTLNSSWCSA